VGRGLHRAAETGERCYEAELHRLKGELVMQMHDGELAAEESFRSAIEVARQQGSRAWELRAATGLGRLMRKQGQTEEAQEVIGPTYHWFSEGFDTADLRGAQQLLESVA
jgi:predicted ATPase